MKNKKDRKFCLTKFPKCPEFGLYRDDIVLEVHFSKLEAAKTIGHIHLVFLKFWVVRVFFFCCLFVFNVESCI